MLFVHPIDIYEVIRYSSTDLTNFLISGQLQRKWNGTGSGGSKIFIGKKSNRFASMTTKSIISIDTKFQPFFFQIFPVQGPYERNYHVFYYLLSGATDQERDILHLLPADKYCYLNAKNLTLENCDEKYEFSRLKQSMEMVGFSAEKQRRLFNVLSAVLLLGNVEFFPKKSTYHHDESVQVRNHVVVGIISELLKVKQDTLLAALTSKRVKASGETLIMQYKLPEAIAARDALAKCLYGALFDWIVLQVNHALLNKDQALHTGHSIGVLDIFGFEDFGSLNSFEQLCVSTSIIVVS